MWEIRISKEDIEEMRKRLDERKAISPDRISGYILKACRQKMAEPIHDIIECFIKTGEVPQEWKKADAMPIYRKGYKEPLNYRPMALTSKV